MAEAPQPVYVTIGLGTILKTIFVLIALVVLYLIRDLVLVVLISVVIASAIEPFTKRLTDYRVPRVPAVIFIYLVTFGVVLVGLPFLTLPIFRDLSEFSTTVVQTLGGIPAFLSASPFGAWTGTVGTAFSFQNILLTLQSNFSSLPKGFVQTASFVFGGFFRFILIVVISFYLSVQKNGIENFLRIITPVNREKYVVDLWKRSQHKIGLWMQGQLLLGLIMGILVFLGLTILQVKYALVLALLAAVFELIPFFGPVLSAVPAVFLAFGENLTLGFMVIGLYIIMQQFENHLIYPLVVKKIVGVPALLVILSLLVGAQLAGFLGILLAVPLSTVLVEAAGDFEKSKYLFRKLDEH